MSDINVQINPPASIPVTIGQGITPHAATHAPGASDSLAAFYVTGSVVRPSETGQFITSGQTGSFITTSQTGVFLTSSQTGILTGDFYPLKSNPSGYVQGAVVRPSNTGGFLDTGSNQTVSSLKNFTVRPTVNGTGVLLSGESAINTGSLTGAFYPLNANPSGYITGVDLSSYVLKSSTGIFVTTGETGVFVTSFQTGQFVSTGATGDFATGSVVRPSETGVFVTVSQTGQFVSTGSTGNFVTGSVVRPSETGDFITTSQTGQFVGTGATGSFVTSSSTGAFLTTGAADGRYALQSATGSFITTGQTGQFVSTGATGIFVTGSVVRPSETGVFVTNSQTGIFITTGQTGQFVSTGSTGNFVSNNQTGEFLTTGAADNRYALQSNTGVFVTTGQTGQFVTGSVVRPSETGQFVSTSETGNFAVNSQVVFITGNQDVSGVKSFYSRPTVNGTGVLLSGEATAANTGELTGIFYPLNSNPSGYITGVDLSSYATTVYVTGISGHLQTQITSLNDQTGNYVTGSVVRPSETGVFITTGQTGQFYPISNPSGFLVSGSPVDLVHLYAKNDQGSTIYRGQPVFINGANGANPLIKLASNTGESTSSKTIGLLAQDLLVNEFGYVVTEGALEGFNTSSGNAGDPMWLGTSGNIIYGLANKPYGNNHLVYLGVVLRSNNDNGKVYVKVQNGFEIDELHKVYAKNASNLDALIYDSGSGAWFARQITTGDVSGISAYALASNTGSFITSSQTGQFVSTGSTGSFVVSSATGAFLTTGAADGRYYGLANGQLISGFATTGFNNAVTGISVTGDTTKFITLFQRDGTTISSSFTDNAGTGGGGGGSAYPVVSYSRWQVTGTTGLAYSITGAQSSPSEAYRVTVNSVIQDTALYTIDASGDTISFLSAPPSGADIVIIETAVSGISGTSSAGGSSNIWIPAAAWIPRTTSGCGVDSRELATNRQNFDELLFDAASNEFAQALTILPNNYNNGTITSRFYWTASTGSGDVVWGVQGRAFANDDALDSAFGTAQTVTDSLLTIDDMHISNATAAVTFAGTPAANTPIQLQIYRDAAAGGDTMANDARLLGVEIIYTTA